MFILILFCNKGGSGNRRESFGVVYAREVDTPDLPDQERSDSDDSETDENRPKFANSEGTIQCLVLGLFLYMGNLQLLYN